MSECIFCKIIAGEIPGKKIYEDDYTLAFMDVAKDVDGHTLVVPKKHVTNFLDCDQKPLHHVMDPFQKLSRHYIENCGYDGINLYSAANESSGQSVFHYHMHIVPRKSGDGVQGWPQFGGAKHSLEEIFEKIKF